MHRYLIFIIVLFFTSCLSNSNRKPRFTKEQIESLALDSTKILTVDQGSAEKIDLNPFLKQQDFDLGLRVADLDIVPLQTTDESLLDVVYKVLVTDSNIYVHDRLKGGGLVIFDRSGKFIKRMPYGQGPGEINRLYDIAFDSENNKLIVYQHSFLIFYTANGKFIEQKRLPFGFYNFKVTSDGYLLKTLDGQGNEHLGSLKNNTLLITDTAFKVKSLSLPYAENDINYGGYYYLYDKGENFTITQRFVDTIYTYNNRTDKLSAKYILSFEDKKLPATYLEGSMVAFEKAISQNDYYYYLGEYLETDKHDVFFLMNQHTGLKTIVYRDKNTKRLIGGTHAVYDDVKEIPSMSFPIATYKNDFIALHYPNKKDISLLNSTLLSAEAKKDLSKLTEDDNPVLVLFKLKDF